MKAGRSMGQLLLIITDRNIKGGADKCEAEKKSEI